jgi:peroxiredoxin family protein
MFLFLNGLKALEKGEFKRILDEVAVIINSASYERVLYALNIASVSAALGKKTYVLFTYGALIRLIKGRTDEIGEETEAWIRESIKAGLKKGSISKISEALKDLKKFGGKLYACVSAMAFHNVTKDELIEEVDEVIGIAAFLETIKEASITFYI